MMKAMLIGIGLGKDVEYAIHSSIKYNNPNFVVFVVTRESINTLDRSIESETGKALREVIPEHVFIILDSPEIHNEYDTWLLQ